MKRVSLFSTASVACGLLMTAAPADSKVRKTAVDLSSSLAKGKHIPKATVQVRKSGGAVTPIDPAGPPPAPKPLPIPYPNVGGPK